MGLKLKQRKNDIEATIYSIEEITEENMKEALNVLKIGLGADVDLQEFYEIAKKDSILKLVIQDPYGMKPYFANSVFGRTLLAIILQMAPIKEKL
ncbi:MAG: hypothetical protein ACUVXA_01810 [Candidatus Jordarchaeum sp.]|uniref:hypothetical protein n=1 Tax=Candidatus Jordarchaeum sp. TaxID=2823881 RepID=UPI00404AE522